jgi:DNA topoisomerase-1
VDLGFTARMEANLDKVAGGHLKWEKTISEFYTPFAVTLKRAQAEMPVTKAELEKIGRACPDCGKDLVFRWGRYGKFISCSGFPECRHTEAWLEKIGVTCPKDGGDVVKRKSRKGRVFFGCANYPNCDFTTWKEPLAIPCPNCKGMLVVANKREAQCLDCEETFLLENLSTESTGEPEMA